MKINFFAFCFLSFVAVYAIHSQFGMSVRAHVVYSSIALLAWASVLMDQFMDWRQRRIRFFWPPPKDVNNKKNVMTTSTATSVPLSVLPPLTQFERHCVVMGIDPNATALRKLLKSFFFAGSSVDAPGPAARYAEHPTSVALRPAPHA